jgi:outer membrane protein OmpA-like peptidoglycan-associated protein
MAAPAAPIGARAKGSAKEPAPAAGVSTHREPERIHFRGTCVLPVEPWAISAERDGGDGYPSLPLQRKLAIGATSDPLEAEADRVAAQVMRSPYSSLSLSTGAPLLRRKCACESSAEPCPECRKKKQKTLQRKSAGHETAHGSGMTAPPVVHQVLASPGQPLDTGIRNYMEPRFQADFSSVRIHTDARAHESARAVNALAYTVGTHLVFSSGQYQPHSRNGGMLLAHELAHVLQQDGTHTLRRACGPKAIGEPTGCEPSTPVFTPGKIFRFVVNCDDWLGSAADDLRAYAKTLAPGANIQIDGYASAEGPEAYNVKLSCARANKAKDLLIEAGIPAARITRIVDHGPTSGNAADRRSVVVRPATAAAPPQSTPQATPQNQPQPNPPGQNQPQPNQTQNQPQRNPPGQTRTTPSQPAPAPVDCSTQSETREIAAFDVTPGNKRPWNLNQLTVTIVKSLQADSRAYVRIFGVYPTIAGEDDPQQNAFDRAETVRKALIQWIGPGKFSEDRFDVAFADGQIGDPQISVNIACKGQILSNPTTPLGTESPDTGVSVTPGASGPTGESKTDSDDSDLQSAIGGQWTWHMNRPGKVERSVQVQLTKGSGNLQSVYQFAVNLDTGDVQALVGAQLQKETRTVKVLTAALKVKASVFLDLLAGITRSKGAASGSITFQVQGGVQVTAIFGPVTVSLQAAPSITYQAGQPISIDFNLAPQGGMSSLPEKNLPPFLGIPIIVGTF